MPHEKAIDTALKLLNIEKHNAVETNAHGKKYVPVSTVRALAHDMLVELRRLEAADQEALTHMKKAEKILIGLNRIKGEEDARQAS